MNTEERAAVVKYRMQRAEETFAEVSVLIGNDLLNTAVNRLYYACFYAVSALLVNHGISATTHSGTRRMFGLHFVKPGKIEKSLGKFYSDIFDQRHDGDYADFIDFEAEDVQSLMEPASKLVAAIKNLLDKR